MSFVLGLEGTRKRKKKKEVSPKWIVTRHEIRPDQILCK